MPTCKYTFGCGAGILLSSPLITSVPIALTVLGDSDIVGIFDLQPIFQSNFDNFYSHLPKFMSSLLNKT